MIYKAALLFILFILSALTSQAAKIELTDKCRENLKGLAPGWKYDYVMVPERYDIGDIKQSLFPVFFYFKTNEKIRSNTPILFLNGGPTVSGITASHLFDRYPDLSEKNIILMDQRGTGCSGDFPSDPSKALNYTSRAIVIDAEAIRVKIGGQNKWKVFGQSFGAFTTLRYLEMFPESIESAHMHGFGVTSEGKDLTDLRENQLRKVSKEFLAFESEGENIQNLVTSLTARPEIAQKFESLCEEVPRAPRTRFCGTDLFDGLYLTIGFNNQWASAHTVLSSILKSLNEDDIPQAQKQFSSFARRAILRFTDPAQAQALNLITYMELIPGKFFYSGCKDVKENEIFSECRYNRRFLIRLNENPINKPVPLDLNAIKVNIRNLGIPVFYYGGLKDSFMPPTLIRETAEKLDIPFVLFENSGHEGFYSEPLLRLNL